MHHFKGCYAKDHNLVTRSIAGETIIVPIRGGVGDLESIYILNEVAATIWKLIERGTPVCQLIDVISTEYDVTAAKAAQDIGDFLASLEAAGLIWPTVEREG
jgi:hypothetical protein